MKDLKTLKRMISELYYILDSKQRLQMLGMFFVILIGAGFELLGVSAMLPFIQSLLSPDELMDKWYVVIFLKPFGVTDADMAVFYVGMGIIGIYLVKNIYLLFSSYLQAAYDVNLLRELSTLMLKAYLNQPYEYFAKTNTAEISRGVSFDTTVVATIVETLFKFLAECITAILLAIYLVIVDPSMAVGILVIGAFCVMVITSLFKKKITNLANENREYMLVGKKWVLESAEGIKDIFVFNKRDYFLRGYDQNYEKQSHVTTKYKFLGFCPERIIEALCISGIIVTVLLRIKAGVDVNSFVPELAVFAMAAFRMLPSISRITGHIGTFLYSRPSLEATYENVKTAHEVLARQAEAIDEENEEKKTTFDDEVIVDNIGFRYSDGEEDVLTDLSISIKKGESIGLVGESGAGKSTLADILLRLYPTKCGNITIDSIDINTIPNQWSKLVSYVPQGVFLLDDTVRKNVAFAEDDISDEKVWAALEQAHLKEFVESLPQGLDTFVGERGVRFSGGQCQRIAIARALYRDPEIIVLDEATSALDNDTEEAVMEAINALQGNKTLIIIAHRLTTIANCDKIYEVSGGKAVLRTKEEVLGE